MVAHNITNPKLSAEGEVAQLGCQVQVESHLSGWNMITTSIGYNKMTSVMGPQDIIKKIMDEVGSLTSFSYL
jgi:hypothetical protein